MACADDALPRELAVFAWTQHMTLHTLSEAAETRLRGAMMRNIFLALFAVGGVSATALAQTAATQYPFCIQGVDNPGYSGCSYSTLQACQASASGTEAECITNPWYSADNGGGATSSGSPAGPNAPIAIGPPPEN